MVYPYASKLRVGPNFNLVLSLEAKLKLAPSDWAMLEQFVIPEL